MSGATIFKILSFFPIDEIQIVEAVMAIILYIASFVMTNESVVIIKIIRNRYRETTCVAIAIKAFTERLINIVTIGQRRLVSYFRIIPKEGVSAESSMTMEGIPLKYSKFRI